MKELLDYSPLQRVSFARPLNPMTVGNVIEFDNSIPVFEFERDGHKCYAFGCLVNDHQALIYPKSFFQPHALRSEPACVSMAMIDVSICDTLRDLRMCLSGRTIRITDIRETETHFGLRRYPVFEWVD